MLRRPVYPDDSPQVSSLVTPVPRYVSSRSLLSQDLGWFKPRAGGKLFFATAARWVTAMAMRNRTYRVEPYDSTEHFVGGREPGLQAFSGAFFNQRSVSSRRVHSRHWVKNPRL